ncbi:amino acid permease domain-containing protein [Trichoderma breve]|uniref:Amino acid permease domain-containing protein n=1 Tax=Trichoderma breve TaxID=2034170 RepID=A0A9W9B750_9HYPO|nr:amino acid permease domain-containing protein [Trichoderma breve]KAJ4854698.1 amino acid permease domain-containing protein [Trichoderma breve]
MAMAFAILNTWIALAGSIGLVLPSGSSVALLYGFIFCVLCCFCVAASLGELSSIWPTAGGQYHFVYALCTERWRKPMSFVVGWANIVGWLVVVTVQDYFGYDLAQFISAAAVVASNGSYQITPARTYGIFVAVLVFTTVANIWGNRILGKWNDAALYWSIFGVVIISIVLLSMSDKTSAEFVFTDFNNETGWSDGMAWILGLLQSALSLIAFDVVLHMTEEMPNPSRDAPRAMLYSIVIGGVTGFAFILVMLFCLVDPDTILSTPTGMPIVELILQATKSRAAATILSLMLSVCFINGTNASITSVSRLLYAMARDRGIVFHNYFAHIQSGLNVPVRTIMFCFVFNILFGLLYLGPVVAFSAYVASCTIFLNMSYSVPILVLLVRGRKVLANYQSAKTPFKMGRVFGLIVNIIAALYVVVTSVFFCFPTFLPVTGNNMNYVCVVIGIFAMVVGVYWIFFGKNFLGPQDIIVAEFDGVVGRPVSTQNSSEEDKAEKGSHRELK